MKNCGFKPPALPGCQHFEPGAPALKSEIKDESFMGDSDIIGLPKWLADNGI